MGTGCCGGWADRATTPSYFAGGHGGQYVVVVPELGLVVVTMGDADAMAYPGAGLALRRLVHRQVVPAFRPPVTQPA